MENTTTTDPTQFGDDLIAHKLEAARLYAHSVEIGEPVTDAQAVATMRMLSVIRDELDHVEARMYEALRVNENSWTAIAEETGHSSKQAAQQRYSRVSRNHPKSSPVVGDATTADVVAVAPDVNGTLCVLLGQRSTDSDAYPGSWALPGGYRDDGEHTRTTAAREAAEETGAQLAEADLIAVGHYATPGRDPRGEVSSDAYTVRLDQTVDVDGRDDLDAAMWVPVTEATIGVLAFDHGQILRDALRLLA